MRKSKIVFVLTQLMLFGDHIGDSYYFIADGSSHSLEKQFRFCCNMFNVVVESCFLKYPEYNCKGSDYCHELKKLPMFFLTFNLN